MSDKPSYYIEVFNSLTNTKGFLVDTGESYAVAEYPIPAMVFFDTEEQASQCIADNQIESDYFKAVVKEQGALIAEGAVTVISVKGWYIANDDGWKLFYNHLTNIYHFDKRNDGYLVWLDKKIADRALIKFTKQFNVMKLHLEELIPQTEKHSI